MSLINTFADSFAPRLAGSGRRLSQAETSVGVHGVLVEVHRDFASVADDWAELQARAIATPHQTFQWAKAWYDVLEAVRGESPVVVIGRCKDGKTQFLLPLVLSHTGPFRVLKLLGGNQGNYGSALYDPNFLASCTRESFLSLWKDIKRKLPRHALIHFRSLVHDAGTQMDPLKWLPTVCSAEYGHAFAIEPDTDPLYRSCFNAKSRAEHRRCERRLADAGPMEFECATEPERLVELFAHLSAQRAAQARDTGVPNPLAGLAVQQFYNRYLASPRHDGEPIPYIFALHCGDEIAATNFGVRHHDRFYGLLMTTAPGPLRRYGPGTALFRRMVQHLASDGCTMIDCGAGRDPHKLHWCNQTRERCDALAPSNLLGIPVVAAMRLSFVAKRIVKNDDRVWPVMKHLMRALTMKRQKPSGNAPTSQG